LLRPPEPHVQPMPPAGLRQSRGNSGNSPRRSSSIDQSGESQSCSGCLPFASGDTLPPLADPLAGGSLTGHPIVASACSMCLRISSRDIFSSAMTLTPNDNQRLHLVRRACWGNVRLEVLQPVTDGAQLLGIQF